MSTSLHVYKDVQLPMVISLSVLIYRDRNIVCKFFPMSGFGLFSYIFSTKFSSQKIGRLHSINIILAAALLRIICLNYNYYHRKILERVITDNIIIYIRPDRGRIFKQFFGNYPGVGRTKGKKCSFFFLFFLFFFC